MIPVSTMAFVLALAVGAQAAPADPVVGEWLGPGDNAKVRIGPCAAAPDQLCATLVWLRRGTDAFGKPLLDQANPDPAQRSRPLLGVNLVAGLTRDEIGRWSGGRVYDPDSGKTYRSRVNINKDGTLTLEGCIAIICKSQTWRKPAP